MLRPSLKHSADESGAAAAPAERARSVALQNSEVAAQLEEVADILAARRVNPYRVRAYREAARAVRGWPTGVADIARTGGLAALEELPGVGERLARAIYSMAFTGRLPMLERLRSESDPLELLMSVPGVGRKTALRIHEELGVHTLEELEMAAHDGRLEKLGIGVKRMAGIRDALAGRLGRSFRRPADVRGPLPPVAEILDVDREYRESSAHGGLPKIAPRRFNPTGDAWLPVLHTERGDRDYTALFSNTARAHELGRTHDWVVLYFDGPGAERQCTVITAERGPLRGRRIVRGREAECMDLYARQDR